MLRLLFIFVLFIGAFLLAVRAVVAFHTFFADVPIEPLLTENGVTVFLYFYFSFAALGGALSLTLRGISTRRLLLLAATQLATLVVVVELYVLFVERVAASGSVLVIAAMVANAALIVVFFRVALWAISVSGQIVNLPKRV